MLKKLVLLGLVAMLASATAVFVGCDSDGDGDADGDADGDGDGDGDADGDADGDSDGDADGDGDSDGDGDGDGDGDSDCDPVEQTGCEDGSYCAIYDRLGDGNFRWDCMTVPEDQAAVGAPCTYTQDPVYGYFDNCVGGAYCTGSSAEDLVCIKLCLDDDASYCNDAYPDGEGGFVDGICNLNVGFEDSTGILACLEPSGCDPHCDNSPHDGNPCTTSEMCVPAQDSGDNFGTICITPSRSTELDGDGIAGDLCATDTIPGYINSCALGFICTGDDTCHAMCDFTRNEQCAAPAGDGDADVDVDADVDADADADADAAGDADAADGGGTKSPDEETCPFECCGNNPGEESIPGTWSCLQFEDSADTFDTIQLGVCGVTP
jgi:hypothetical protein